MVSTLDFESKDPSSNLGGAYFTESSFYFCTDYSSVMGASKCI